MLQPNGAILSLVSQAAIAGSVDDDLMADAFNRFLEFFESDSIVESTFVGVFGLEVVDGPINLPGGIVLMPSEGRHLDALIEAGVGREAIGVNMGFMLPIKRVSCLPDAVAEAEYEVPVRRAGINDSQERAEVKVPDMNTAGERLLGALALTTNARVARTAPITRDRFPLGRGMTYGPHPRTESIDGARHQLTASNADALVEMYSQVSSEGVERRAYLTLAIRRFLLALTRDREDDRLIDLSIAAEALLMDQRDELSLRLALSAAVLAEGTQLAPRDVYEAVRTAYRLRSKVVHGEDVAAKDVKHACHSLETNLRAILGTYVRRAAVTDGRRRLEIDIARYIPRHLASDE